MFKSHFRELVKKHLVREVDRRRYARHEKSITVLFTDRPWQILVVRYSAGEIEHIMVIDQHGETRAYPNIYTASRAFDNGTFHTILLAETTMVSDTSIVPTWSQVETVRTRRQMLYAIGWVAGREWLTWLPPAEPPTWLPTFRNPYFMG